MWLMKNVGGVKINDMTMGSSFGDAIEVEVPFGVNVMSEMKSTNVNVLRGIS